MATYINSFFEERVERLFELGLSHRRRPGCLPLCRGKRSRRGPPYKDIDIAVRRQDLLKISAARGLKLIPLPDLLKMKLTSFRAKDEAHLKDMDEIGLITPQIEGDLPPLLKERLGRVRER